MSTDRLDANASNDDVEQWLDANAVTWVRTEGLNVDGVLSGKHLHRSKFLATLPTGNAIGEIAFGLDLGGDPYFSWWPDWRRDALGDFIQRPDLSTLALVPGQPGMASVIVEHHAIDGTPLPVCGRAMLHRIVEQVAAAGYSVKAAFELEGMLFSEPVATARSRHFRRLTPNSHPSPVGYSHYNAAQMQSFVGVLCERLLSIGVGIEGWHDEAAPGQFEINFEPATALDAADAIVRAKQAARELAIERGCTVTFMAKPVDAYGNGLHVHHSLRLIRDGSPVLLDERGAMSSLMRDWLAGIVATMPATTSLMSPSINSYRRMVEWAAAPTTATWAEDNKTVGVRVLTRSAESARIEHRLAAGDANPYLVLAAVLAGGLAGLAEPRPLPEALTVSGWGLPAGWPHLPRTISSAADRLSADVELRAQLGDQFVDHWVESRRWEWLMFNTNGGDATATTVTNWELDRYFELA